MTTDPQPVVWIDGDPVMEAIAAAVWERCEQHDSGLVVDDPRNIAAVAASVAVSSAVGPSAPAKTALRDRIAAAIKTSPFHELRTVDHAPNGPLQITAKVDDLTDAVLAVLPAVADRAELTKQIDYRDYWHAEAMSATTRIIELEGQLEELRPRLADELPAAAPAVSSVGLAAHTTRGTEWRAAADEIEAQQTRIEREERDEHGGLDHETELQGDAVRGMATHLRRMADETQPAEDAKKPPMDPVHILGIKADEPAVCGGFQWIGQSFATCDRCRQPAWEHAGEEVPIGGEGPFDPRRTIRPWGPGEADAMRAKWEPAVGAQQPKEA